MAKNCAFVLILAIFVGGGAKCLKDNGLAQIVGRWLWRDENLFYWDSFVNFAR